MTTTEAVTFVFDYGHGRHHGQPCPLCGSDDVDWDGVFGLAVKDGARACEDCVLTRAPDGTGLNLLDYVEALEQLDTAVHSAPAYLRPGLLGNAVQVMGRLAKLYAAEEHGS